MIGRTVARVAPSGTPTCRGDLGRANGPASGMGGAFRVVCCVAPSGTASAAELARLPAPRQPSISVAGPTTSISPTNNRVRFATRIPQRSSMDGASFFGRFFPFHAPCKALLARPKSISSALLFLASPAPGPVVRPAPEDGGGVQRARVSLAQWPPEQGRM